MIKVDNINKIQEIRAIQALSDLNVDIKIKSNEEYKFSLLRDKFNMSYNTLDIDLDLIDYRNVIIIDHSKPITSILSVSKPLIYSKKIPLYLKSKWNEERPFQFSFSGLITSQRKLILENWINHESNKKIKINTEKISFKIIRKFYSHFNIRKLLIRKYGNLYLWVSNKGRMFPIKTWDQDYYDFLLKSKFVLCPSGDFVWTYRFYEAIMCGAIPVVQESCDAYNGFKFYLMEEGNKDLQYDLKMVNHNFELLIERLTISESETEALKNEIIQLAKNKLNNN